MRRYEIIYADPPWRYRDRCDDGARGAAHKYRVVRTAELASLPVGDLAAPDCALFMWATFPMLRDAMDLMAAWGFRYSTVAFVWVKLTRKGEELLAGARGASRRRGGATRLGMGHWTRANAEVVFLGTRGRPRRASASVRQVVLARPGRHSAKPVLVRDRIVELMGDRPRVELFARSRGAGWDAHGDELAGPDVLRCVSGAWSRGAGDDNATKECA